MKLWEALTGKILTQAIRKHLARRRQWKRLKWMQKNRVLFLAPHHTTLRNGPEALP